MGGIDWTAVINRGFDFGESYFDRELVKDNFEAYAMLQNNQVSQPVRSEPANPAPVRYEGMPQVPGYIWLAVIAGGALFIATR